MESGEVMSNPRVHVTLRLATVDDAPALVDLVRIVWPEDSASLPTIIGALRAPDHATCVAVVADQVVGFCDGFTTVGSDGVRRWEVDLVAVHPDQRGRGLGVRLIAASSAAGQAHGAACARGLIALANTPSQRAFQRNGYRADPIVRELYVCRTLAGEGPNLPAGAFLTPVHTLIYRGGWIEKRVTEQALWAARASGAARGWDCVGVLLAADDDLRSVAAALGFAQIGAYRWWRRALAAP